MRSCVILMTVAVLFSGTLLPGAMRPLSAQESELAKVTGEKYSVVETDNFRIETFQTRKAADDLAKKCEEVRSKAALEFGFRQECARIDVMKWQELCLTAPLR